MRVIATAGHVDHGKSTLVRALTGMQPDRWAEERRRGMTIDLGFAWTDLGDGQPVAFVDVPGHQRFVTNMLAGVGPVPAVLMVVAADAGWSRQTSEHLDAIEAFGIRHAVLAVTRADLASPEKTEEVLQEATKRLGRGGLNDVDAVAVSSVTGAGLAQLRIALTTMLERLPPARTDSRVRLWIDRSFSVKGAGTVLTGTLGAGRISVGDELELNQSRYNVRGIQQLGVSVHRAEAVSRVAVNLRGADRNAAARGDCLLTPDAWTFSNCLDVSLQPLLAAPSGQQVLHIGSASIGVTVRMLGEGVARLRLPIHIPVQHSDRGVLRDASQQSITAGVVVLDADPPVLRRRGAARARGADLASGRAGSFQDQVARRGAVQMATLRRLGIEATELDCVLRYGDWLIYRPTWQRWLRNLTDVVRSHGLANPRLPSIPEAEVCRLVGIPDGALLGPLTTEAGLTSAKGRIGAPGAEVSFGSAEPAMTALLARLAKRPFDAPDRDELISWGVDSRDLAAAVQSGRLLQLAPGLVVATDAVEQAQHTLGALMQPFTASQARQALGTTRRVALPLLEHLDRLGITERLDSSVRTIKSR